MSIAVVNTMPKAAGAGAGNGFISPFNSQVTPREVRNETQGRNLRTGIEAKSDTEEH